MYTIHEYYIIAKDRPGEAGWGAGGWGVWVVGVCQRVNVSTCQLTVLSLKV